MQRCLRCTEPSETPFCSPRCELLWREKQPKRAAKDLQAQITYTAATKAKRQAWNAFGLPVSVRKKP